MLAVVRTIAVCGALVLPVPIAAQLQPKQAANPVPLIDQPLVPDAGRPGGAAFKLTVNGTGFVAGSAVQWNGKALATHVVTESQLLALVSATDIAKPGTASVTVVNSAPGGGTSNVRFFEVVNPTLSVTLHDTDYAAGGSPTSVTTGDFNGDGKLDLAVVNGFSSPGTVGVLLGNGDGTFQPLVAYTVGDSARDLTAADFNGDGKLDLAVTNNGGGSVSILLGNGDGTFQSQTQYSTGAGPWGLTAADFNGDGKLDLAVTNDGAGTVSILLGNGDGTFQPHVDYGTGSNPECVAVGDFNRDGILDLATADKTSNSITILLGNGDGTFSPGGPLTTGPLPRWVTVADLNGDGYLDLAEVTDYPSPPTVAIYLGNGNGTFQSPVTYPIASDGTSVVTGDFNGDGKLDLATSDFNGGSGNTVSILLGNGDGTFQPRVDYATAAGPNQLIAGDFNGDGRLDLAVADQDSSMLSVLLQIRVAGVSVLPASLTFGTQAIGSSGAAQIVTITSTGELPLDISSIAVTGTDATDFNQTSTCGPSLAVGASCTISVIFSPAQPGPLTAAVTITDNAEGSPHSVTLSGTGVSPGPNVTLSPASLTFATELVGVTSSPQPVTLSNYGSAALSIAGIRVTGAGPNEFGETSTCHSLLAAGASCTINIIFSPSQRGAQTSDVSIGDNAPGSPQTVNLQGIGTVVDLNPTSLDFGDSTKPLTTTLKNVGSGPVSITGVSITGTDDDAFAQTNTCGSSVAGGASCTVTVTFSPKHPGTSSAALSIGDNGGGSPQSVALSGVVGR